MEDWRICADCAIKKKWTFPKWPVTCARGTCAYCKKKDKTLIPILDFGRGKTKPIWD